MSTVADTTQINRVNAALWVAAIMAGTLFPGVGLALSVAAVLTTFRGASTRVKVVVIALGVLTTIPILGTFVLFTSP